MFLILLCLLSAIGAKAHVPSVYTFKHVGVKGRIQADSALQNWFGKSAFIPTLVAAAAASSSFLGERPANYEVANVPCPEKPQKILFVTAKVAESSPEAVKAVFLRHKCAGIGLLLRGSDLAAIVPNSEPGLGGLFFSSSRYLTVSNCQRIFRRMFGVRLHVGLVNSCCEAMPSGVLSDFDTAGIVLYRHPSCFFGTDYFYSDSLCRKFPESEDFLYVNTSMWLHSFDELPVEFEWSFVYQLSLLARTDFSSESQQASPTPLPLTDDPEMEDIPLSSSSASVKSESEQDESNYLDDDYEFVDPTSTYSSTAFK